MSCRFFTAGGVLGVVVVVVTLGLVPADAQTPSTAARRGVTTPLPRTPWGDPDLQGIWNNGTITPLERPTAAGQKDILSEEETSALNEEAATRAQSDRRPPDKVADLELAYNAEWWDRGKSIGRTSLIVDPEDGRLPPLTP